MEKTIASQDEGLKWRARQVEELQNEKARLLSDLNSTLHSTEQQLKMAEERLEGIYASSGWKFVLRVRHIRDRLKRLLGLTS
jgi:hypothetical protein